MKQLVSSVFLLVMVVTSFLLNPEAVSASRENILYQSELDYPPFKYDQNGYPAGFDLELTRLLFEEDKYSIYYSFDAWDKVYAKLTNKEIDTAGLMAVLDERKNEISYSKPVMKTTTGIFTKENFAEAVTLRALSDYRIGVGTAQYTEQQLKSELGITDYSTFATVQEGLYALREGEIDLLFENQQVVNYLLIREGLSDEIRMVIGELYPVDFAYGVRKNSPELVSYLNSRITEVQGDPLFEELYQRYFFSHSDYYNEKIRNRYITAAALIVISGIVGSILIRLYINRLRRTLQGEREFSNDVLKHTNLFIWAVKADGRTVRLNQYAERLIGISEEQAEDCPYDELDGMYDHYPELMQMLDEALNMQFAVDREVILKRAEEEGTIALLFRTTSIQGLEGDPDVFVLAGMDIQERKESEIKLQNSYQELEATYEELTAAQEELADNYKKLLDSQELLARNEERYRLVTEASNGGIWEIDLIHNKNYYSLRWFQLLGYEEEDQVRRDMIFDLIHPDDAVVYANEIEKACAELRSLFECEFRLRMKCGEYHWFLARGKIVFDAHGEPQRMTGSIIDIHELKLSQDRLHYMAYYDELSGLPNRHYFMRELENFSGGPDRHAALFFIDTDNFKYVNDTLGHKAGDLLLVETSNRLSEAIDKEKMLFRLGGDEFVIMQEGIREAAQAECYAEKLIDMFKEPFYIQGSELYISVSIGISLYPQDGTDPEELLKNADMAMYAAKEAGKGKYMVFTPAFQEAFYERVKLERHLRQAVQNGELLLHYQPQLDLHSERISGFEALVRWNSPELGFVSPLSFIKVAEDSRLIIPIGDWVLREACRFGRRLQDEGYGDFLIGVNISVVQLLQDDFADKVQEALRETGLNPRYLELEITESTIMESFDGMIDSLTQLRDMGVSIALDDFGTGYSSLGYLKQMPITTLKIDKSFIEQIPDEGDSRSLARAIVLIGRKMGLKVVAEGVETQQQLKYIKRSRCDVIQGYLISRPVPEQEALALAGSNLQLDI